MDIFSLMIEIAITIPWWIWLIIVIAYVYIHKYNKNQEHKQEIYRRERFIKPYEPANNDFEQNASMWLNELDRDSHRHK